MFDGDGNKVGENNINWYGDMLEFSLLSRRNSDKIRVLLWRSRTHDLAITSSDADSLKLEKGPSITVKEYLPITYRMVTWENSEKMGFTELQPKT